MSHPSPAPRYGVTLLELMIVLSVIGISLTLLLPNFMWAKNSARDGELSAALIRAGQAQERYASRYERYWTAGQPQDLLAFGLEVPTDITVFVVNADASTYCMEAFASSDTGRRFSLAAGEAILEVACAGR